MKKLIFLVIITSCANSNNNNKQASDEPVIKKCEKTVLFGDKEICLPTMNNYTECYLDSRIKDRVDEAVGYNGRNTVLAVYLIDKVYNQINDSSETFFDDYYILFGNKRLADHDANNSEIKNLIGTNTNRITKEQWEKIKNNLENEIKSVDVRFDKLIEIEDYFINDNVSTVVTLQRVNINGKEIFKVTIMNVVLLNKRLVWLCYYKDYKDSETIKYSKERNDYLVRKFIEQN
ncbi:MAG: hypothetical protein JNJ65_05235 [Cyclobacteriaceae bacterium]|nr:hypothetical protein [Cyclobacteriaceae bacterium]